MSNPAEGWDWEGAWADVGAKFQEFLKADPAHGELPEPELHEAFKKWVASKYGKENQQ